jgi:phenylacetate-coenzyme A ligase PaaK-like adenylate-forming protein
VSVEFTLHKFGHPLAIARLRAQFERSQWLTAEELVFYQEQRLREIIRQAYVQVPYYRRLFRRLKLAPDEIRTLADLRQLPLLTKRDLRAEFDQLCAANRSSYGSFVAQTSGTDGEPLHFLLDKPSNVLEFVHYWRHWSWMGYRLGMRFAELSSAFFLCHASQIRRNYTFQHAFGRLLLNSTALSAERVRDYVHAIRKYRPAFLKGTASSLFCLAVFLSETGINDIGFRAIFSTGEMLLPAHRARIESALNSKVYDSYGHMERTVAITECPQGGFHIVPEYGIFELLPVAMPDGRTARRSKIVGTSLYNMSMPLLRYDTGDLAEPLSCSEPCPCGRAAPRISRIDGRQNEAIVTPEGNVIATPYVLLDECRGIMVAQFIQESAERLLVQVVKGPSYTNTDAAEFLNAIRDLTGSQMKIEFRYLSYDALRAENPGKFRAVISKIDSPFHAASDRQGSKELVS